jgi:hypothetical protein
MEWMNEVPKTEGWYWLRGRFSRNIEEAAMGEFNGL